MVSKPIAYTYDADYHCVECTRKRFYCEYGNILCDEHGISTQARDTFRNSVHPVFSTDELATDLTDKEGGCASINCCDCHAIISKRHPVLEEGKANENRF